MDFKILEKIIVDQLKIINTHLKLIHNDIKPELYNSTHDNVFIGLSIPINYYLGSIVLEFTFKENFLESRLYVSEAYNEISSFSEEINANDHKQPKRITNFIKQQENKILNVISGFKFYLPANVRRLLKHSFDILNSTLIDNNVSCYFDEDKTQDRYTMTYTYDKKQSKVLRLIVYLEKNKNNNLYFLKAELATADGTEYINETEFDNLDIDSEINFSYLLEIENFIIESGNDILLELKNIDYYSKNLTDDIEKIIDLLFKELKLADSDIQLTKKILYCCDSEAYNYIFKKSSSVSAIIMIEILKNENLLSYDFDDHLVSKADVTNIEISKKNYNLSILNNFIFSKVEEIIKIVNTPKIKVGVPDWVVNEFENICSKLVDNIKKDLPFINYNLSGYDDVYPIEIIFYRPFGKSIDFNIFFEKIDKILSITITLKESGNLYIFLSDKLIIDLDNRETFNIINQINNLILKYQRIIVELFRANR